MYSELSNDLVTVNSPQGEKLNQKSHYGRLVKDKLELSLIEALYLQEKGKLTIFRKDREISPEDMTRIIKEKDLYGKYLVFKDLRNRGYIVKTGFKYGSEFRLYDRGKAPGEGHSDYLVNVISENYDLNVLDFSSYVRVAHGVNKKLLMAVVDEEGDITYYNVEWVRP